MRDYYENARKVFISYANKQKNICGTSNLNDEEKIKRIKNIDMKLLHTDEVVIEGSKILKNMGANETVMQLGKIIFLSHDIGRFPQMVLTGSYSDVYLKHFSGNDHGKLGGFILEKGKINQQFPNTKIFNSGVIDVVKNHVVSNLPPRFSKPVDSLDIIKNTDMNELFKSQDRNSQYTVLRLIMQILQDVDRLDIYHQILDGRWVPMKCEDMIDSKIFELFYNREYLNMNQLRQDGLWNSNVGELVRLSFVYQLKLSEVAKMILDEDIITNMKNVRNNTYANDAFEYTNKLLKTMIDNSGDIYLNQNIKTKK